MTPGRIEAIKIKANYLNGIAIAILAIGGFAPLIAAVTSGRFSWIEIALLVQSFAISFALNLFAKLAVMEIDSGS